ncbi:hypothetical protein SPWS13_1021 [Shewanella putrefaciens]|nr:hypothetical protein SPWS13_1021 [Shewanella putrefaciens]
MRRFKSSFGGSFGDIHLGLTFEPKWTSLRYTHPQLKELLLMSEFYKMLNIK